MSRVLTLTCCLLASFGLRLWLVSTPSVPPREPFRGFPRHIGQWEFASDGSVPERLEPVLGADDYLLRTYRDPSGKVAELFTAYYAMQYAGESMHSPKNCMAGAGWEPIRKGRLALALSNASQTATVNSYVIERDGQRFVMLYWYQVHGRVVASEYWMKAYLVWDAVWTRRRDGALVRVTVPIRPGSDGKQELDTAVDLGRSSMSFLPQFIPS